MNRSKLLGLLLASTMVLGACGSNDSKEEDTSTEEEIEQVGVEEEEVEQKEEVEVEEVEVEEVAEKSEPSREQKDARSEVISYFREIDSGERSDYVEHLQELGYPEDVVDYAMEGLNIRAYNEVVTRFDENGTGHPKIENEDIAYMLSKFPQESIDHVIDEVKDVDYNEQALLRAKTLRGSNTQIKDELVDIGFTEDQAQYAVDNLE